MDRYQFEFLLVTTDNEVVGLERYIPKLGLGLFSNFPKVLIPKAKRLKSRTVVRRRRRRRGAPPLPGKPKPKQNPPRVTLNYHLPRERER